MADAGAPTDLDWEQTSLVPPHRLGGLLSDARSSRGLTLEDIAAASGGRFGLADLASIERGSRFVADDEIAALAELYGLDTTSVVPVRSRLVIDLDAGLMAVGDRRTAVGPHRVGEGDILARYLSMVYSMRRAEPGATIPLRIDDLDVLGTALGRGAEATRVELEMLMANPRDLVGSRHRLLSRKVLLPAAGVLVAVCAAGALVLVESGSTAPNRVPAARPVSVTVSAQTAAAAAGSARIGDAVVQERNADGTPGPVVVRGVVVQGVAPATTTEIGTAATQERNADGTPGPVVERTGP